MRVTYDHVLIDKDESTIYGAWGMSYNGPRLLRTDYDLQDLVDWVVKEHHPRTIRLDVK